MAETSDSGKKRHRFEHLGRFVDSAVPRAENIGRRVDSAIPRVEEEIKKAIAFLNDEVIPRVRQNSAQALHAAAEHLRKVADHLEASGKDNPS
jgi:hypothetical protein